MVVMPCSAACSSNFLNSAGDMPLCSAVCSRSNTCLSSIAERSVDTLWSAQSISPPLRVGDDIEAGFGPVKPAQRSKLARRLVLRRLGLVGLANGMQQLYPVRLVSQLLCLEPTDLLERRPDLRVLWTLGSFGED
jgi:hypothetical protein